MKFQLKTAVLAFALAGLTLAAKPAHAGFNMTNGLSQFNGLSYTNGLSQLNGLSYINGLSYMNGLSYLNGLAFINGLTGGPQAIAGIWAASGIDPTRSLAQSLSARTAK